MNISIRTGGEVGVLIETEDQQNNWKYNAGNGGNEGKGGGVFIEKPKQEQAQQYKDRGIQKK